MACCGLKCSKAFVLIFNVFFWVSGCAFVALGGLFLLDDSFKNYFTLFMFNVVHPGDPTGWTSECFQIAVLAIIGFGGFVFFFGFFGCCGSCQESKCMLGIYIFVLILISLLEVAVALVAAYYWSMFPETHMSMTLSNKLVADYGKPGHDVFSEAINFTQYDQKCCGIMDYNEYERSAFTNISLGSSKTINKTQIVRPLTCCVLHEVYGDGDEPWQKPKVVNLAGCQSGEVNRHMDALHEQGCFPKLQQWYERNFLILAGACGIFVLIQVLTIIFSICEIRSIPDFDEAYA